MPIRAEFDADRRLLLERGRGALGREDFLAHFDALEEFGLWNGPGGAGRGLRELRVLGDYGDARVELSAADVVVVSMRARARFGLLAPARIAFAAQEDLSFGVVRMLASRASGAGLEIHVFRDVETAWDWLEVSARSPDGPVVQPR